MTLESRLSKLEASILPEVRPPKVVTIQCCRDEDMDAARDRHFAAHPEDRDATLVVSFERYSGATTNDHRLSCYECALPAAAAAAIRNPG